jgi:hypothetical protein
LGHCRGAITTCGTEGVNLTPREMARRPLTVTLWHQGKLITSVRLDQRSGSAFLVVGGTVVRFPYNPKTHEQPFGWSPGFTVRASNGFAQAAGLGGLGGVGEVVFQIPAHPHLHPCHPNKPSIPDVNRESLGSERATTPGALVIARRFGRRLTNVRGKCKPEARAPLPPQASCRRVLESSECPRDGRSAQRGAGPEAVPSESSLPWCRRQLARWSATWGGVHRSLDGNTLNEDPRAPEVGS